MSFEVNEGLFLFSSSDDDIDESLVSWFNHVLCNIHNTTTTATSLQPPFFWRTVHTFTLVSTSLQWPPLYNSHFFGVQSIHSLLFQPLYNGHLSTMATFFCAQFRRCREVELYSFRFVLFLCASQTLLMLDPL